MYIVPCEKLPCSSHFPKHATLPLLHYSFSALQTSWTGPSLNPESWSMVRHRYMRETEQPVDACACSHRLLALCHPKLNLDQIFCLTQIADYPRPCRLIHMEGNLQKKINNATCSKTQLESSWVIWTLEKKIQIHWPTHCNCTSS